MERAVHSLNICLYVQPNDNLNENSFIWHSSPFLRRYASFIRNHPPQHGVCRYFVPSGALHLPHFDFLVSNILTWFFLSICLNASNFIWLRFHSHTKFNKLEISFSLVMFINEMKWNETQWSFHPTSTKRRPLFMHQMNAETNDLVCWKFFNSVFDCE